MRRLVLLSLLLAIYSTANAQPATPPAIHNEAVGTHDLSSDSVGATPGDFRVDEGGAASYSLPILSLPGTAGLSPKLSLDYSARGSVGTLGTGFVLSGQSTFSRCKRTAEAGDGPGPHSAVDFSVQDFGSFCLDGQRVFESAPHTDVVCPSISGTNVGQYRTEMDPATLICGYANEGENTEIVIWLVFPKDGTMRRYGFAGNSNLRPNNAATGSPIEFGYQIQALDRIADATGNTVDFVYAANVANGELLLSEVKYTGKVADRLDMNAEYTRQPFARTAFSYEPMPLASQRVDYYGGSKIALTQRLVEINVYGPANNGTNPLAEVHARRYTLSYGLANTGSRMSRLIAVRECAPGAISAQDVCYPPTRFSWNNLTDNNFPDGFSAPTGAANFSALLTIAADLRSGDVNGDGRQDVVFLKDRNCAAAGSDFTSAQDTSRFRLMVALGNAAGLQAPVATDVFLFRQPKADTGRNWQFEPCNNNAAQAVKLRQYLNQTPEQILIDPNWSAAYHLFDLTGDGRDDLIAERKNGSVFGYFVHPASQNSQSQWIFDTNATDLNINDSVTRDSFIADATGDGLPDLIWINAQLSQMNIMAMVRATQGNIAFAFENRIRIVTNIGFEAGVSLALGANKGGRIADLDGDGAIDLLLSAFAVRGGLACAGAICLPCAAGTSNVCNPARLCPVLAQPCTNGTAGPLDASDVLWQSISEQRLLMATEAQRGTANSASYYLTAQLKMNVQGEFLLLASQCLQGTEPVNRCESSSAIKSASFVDLNGDSYADVWIERNGIFQSDDSTYTYRLNRGSQNFLLTESASVIRLAPRFANQLQLLDVNGDKRTDLLYHCQAGSFIVGTVCTGNTLDEGFYPLRARLWTASGFGPDIRASNGTSTVFSDQDPQLFLSLPLDLNGDGAIELLRYRADASNSQNLYIQENRVLYGGNDYIVKFSNGFNVDHTVGYAPLVSKFTYERAFDGPRKNWGRNSVVFDVFTPLWAVREACSSSPGVPVVENPPACQATGSTATSIIRYSYRGARVQTGGRGFLGFASIRTEDIQNILVTTTDYRQDYPYIGRASRTVVEKRSALIPDTVCLANPTDPSCFREPPDDCGGGICPRPDRVAQRQLLLQSPERFAPLDNPINCQFDASLVPVITDSTSCFTSTPVFAAATQQPIAVFSNTSTEKRYDLATHAQTQRIATLMAMDNQANLTFQQSTTFDAADVEVERKGQINFYGCTETPVVLVKGVGCQSTPTPNLERVRLGRLSLTSLFTVRDGVIKQRRSSFEYDATTQQLNAEVQGLYNYGGTVDPQTPEPPLEQKERMHLRTDYVLDANGNRTLSVTCSVSHFANRAACTNLADFQQQQWPATPFKVQRYTRMEYDTLGRFMQGSRSPYYSASNPNGAEAHNERSGVDVKGALNRTVYGDPLGALTVHNVYAEKFYGPLGREYFARAATGAFGRNTYAWCSNATSTTLPDGSGGIPAAAPRGNCPLGALYRVESNASEGNLSTQFIAPRSFAYFDKLGRNILTTTRLYQSVGADPTNMSRWSSTTTRYDVLGRVKAKSEPYLSKDPLANQTFGGPRAGDLQSGIPPPETITNYDVLGRSASVDLPSELYNGLSVSSAEFDRMQTKSFNPRANPMTMDKNGLAETSLVTDAENFQIAYRYEPQGNMDKVSRTAVLNQGQSTQQTLLIETNLDYDVLGRKSSIVDPDKGTLSYTYNALGELLSQTDAKGQTQSLFYDALGRLIERRENRRLTNGTFQAEPTAKWTYDNALLVSSSQKANGLLISETNGLTGIGQFTRGYSYDVFGRSAALATNLEGTLYYQRTTYDQYGRVFQSFDASTNAASPAGQLQIYSSDGYPIAVREAADGNSGQIYSEVLSLSARQQVRRERYHANDNLVSDRTFEDNTGRLAAITSGSNSGSGNSGSLQKWNFRWDKNGSLSERSDTTNGADWKEEFVYDRLDRLTTVKQTRTNGFATPTSVSLSLAYDSLGNITRKTGFANANLGSYQYKTLEAGCAQSAGPHAASQVNGKSYCYDLNGNNTEVSKNGSVIRTIVYTGFDLAESIVRDEMTPEGRIQAQVSFQYGIDRAMFKRTDGGTSGSGSNCASPDGLFCARFEDSDTPIKPGTANKTTYYVGNVEFIREGITNSTKRYIGSYLVLTSIGNSPATYNYLLRDSLGSIDTIASETGQLKSRQSFNAHGQRRQAAQSGIANSWSTLSLLQTSLFNTSTTTQGYTGHEQLDGVGLIHMNARLYDPEIGRFIQADDFVEPDATQGLNRYSYVLNNPLSATDPSGNFSLRQALGVVVGVVFAIISQQYWVLNNLWASFGTAVAGGFASAAIATGSLKAGLWGAVSAAVFWGIGTAFSELQYAGPKPGANNLVEAVFKRANSGNAVAKIAAHAAAGGTLTELQGGKFGHGFVAAGFTEALSPAVGQIGDSDGFGAILARTAVSAAIGGTASTLSGGSFANGAKTAAFQELFNRTVHSRPKQKWRKMQAGEVSACSSMIGQDVDWSKVQVWSTNYLPFQGSNVLTPNGENMYWGRNYMEDVTQDFGELARMVHECVHIWQGQTSGTNVIKRRGSYDYSSYLRRGQGWNQMGIEAQADIVTDLFLLLNRYGPQYGNPVGYSPAYLRSLIPFSVPAYDNKQPKDPWGWQ